MKFFRYIMVSSVSLLVVGHAEAQDFSRTLKVGMRGEDVRMLQRTLNAMPETQVANEGPGAPGAETDYFGPATKRALIKLQERYATEILAPLGLSQGTGVFGEKTRNLLGILASRGAATTQNPPMQTVAPPQIPPFPFPSPGIEERSSVIEVHYPSVTSGIVGTKILLKGIGFTPADNTIIFKRDGSDSDTATISGVSSWNTLETALFAVPNVPRGVYFLFVRNTHGESKKYPFFVVVDKGSTAPSIEEVSPLRASPGEVITIRGKGFARARNMVRTSMNVVEGVASPDGTTFSFVIPNETIAQPASFEDVAKKIPAGTSIKRATTTLVSKSTKKFSLPIYVYVVNEYGMSNQKSFTIEF